MFEGLADRLQETFKKLRGHGKLTEDDVNEAMRDVRMALLEADVNFKVVKQFIKTVKERAVGQEVMENLTPAQLVVKIVNEELTTLLGGSQSKINIQPNPPTIIMMPGLSDITRRMSAFKEPAATASIRDCKSEPLPEANTAIRLLIENAALCNYFVSTLRYSTDGVAGLTLFS